jgi:hypothetical protein
MFTIKLKPALFLRPLRDPMPGGPNEEIFFVRKILLWVKVGFLEVQCGLICVGTILTRCVQAILLFLNNIYVLCKEENSRVIQDRLPNITLLSYWDTSSILKLHWGARGRMYFLQLLSIQ